MTTFDPTPYLSQPEGQYFDRKSLWEGCEGQKGIPRIYAELEQVGTEPTHDQTEFTFRMVVPSLLDEERSQLEDKKAPVEEKRHQFIQQYSPTRQKVFRAILEHTVDWITLSDLLERVQKSGNKRFLRDYITPMVQAQILERRGEANAANQAYRRISQ